MPFENDEMQAVGERKLGYALLKILERLRNQSQGT
jgi:hypothetical protein